jgi:hypothetical protein
MVEAIDALLAHDVARRQLGENAVRDARARFGLDRQIAAYLAWYGAVLESWHAHHRHNGN